MTTSATKITVDYIDLYSHWQTFVRHKWLIVSISILMSFFSVAYLLSKPAQYQANALLQIHSNQQNSLGAIQNSQATENHNSSEEPIAVHIALIRSKFILSPLIQALNLDVKVTPYHPHFFSMNHLTKNAIHIQQFIVPPDYINKNLYLYVDKPNHYQLFTHSNHLLLSGDSGALVTNPAGFSIKIDKLLAPLHSQLVLRKLPEWEIMNSIRSRLQITDLAGSADSSPNKPSILQLSFKGNNAFDVMQLINKIALTTQEKDRQRKSLEAKKTLEFLYQELPLVQNSLKYAEAKLNQYRATSGKLEPKLQTRYLFAHLSDIEKQLEIVRIKKIDLAQRFTALHPYMIAINESYKELEKQHAEILDQIKNVTTTDHVAMNLEQEVNVKKNLYMQLLNKIHAQQVVTAGIISDISILSLANLPELSPAFSPLFIGVAGFMVGFVLSCLGILMWQIATRKKVDSASLSGHFEQVSLEPA